MNALFMAGFKQGMCQRRVHERLAAGEGDPAAAAVVEGLVAQHGGHNLLHLLLFTADGKRLRRATVGKGSERLVVKRLTMNDQPAQRAFNTPRRGLLTQVTAVQAQTGIKQDVPRAGAAFRVLTPATAQRAAFQEYHGSNTWAVVGGVTLYIEDHFFALGLHMKIKLLSNESYLDMGQFLSRFCCDRVSAG